MFCIHEEPASIPHYGGCAHMQTGNGNHVDMQHKTNFMGVGNVRPGTVGQPLLRLPIDAMTLVSQRAVARYRT